MYYPDGYEDDMDMNDPDFLVMMDDFMGLGHELIFGGDYNDFEDDDDNSLFESDYDEFSDDSDFTDRDDLHKVFQTLQDSFSVLPQIEFQRSSGAERLPRSTSNQPETYEALHQVLVEVEVLLRALKKRTEHPFTAHLQKDEKSGAEGGELCRGVDYSDEDYDDYEEEGAFFSRLLCNETLTKRKYCQSAKLFFSIFKDEEDCSETLSLVRRVRKTVFSILFAIFLEAFPQDVKDRLPTELWEKIWQMTQKPFKEGFKAGTRAVERKYVLLENDRITEVFGAAGNLHMILFEVLFKNPYILKTPPLLELNCLSGKGAQKMPYARSIFSNCKAQLVAKFARLSVLDSVPGVSAIRLSSDHSQELVRLKEDDAESVETESVESVLSEEGILNKLRQGIWTLQSSEIADESTLKLLAATKPKHQSKALPIVQDFQHQLAYFPASLNTSAQICLYNTMSQRIEQEILIRFDLNSMLEVFFKSERSEDKRFCAFDDSFACISRDNVVEYESVWPDNPTLESVLPETDILEEVAGEKENPMTGTTFVRWTRPKAEEDGATSAESDRHSWTFEKHKIEVELGKYDARIFQLEATRLKSGQIVYLISFHCMIVIYDPDKRQIIFKKEDPESKYVVDGLINGRALLRTPSSIEFFCLDSFKVLDTFHFNDLNKKVVEMCGNNSKPEELNLIRSKFDCNPERKQFVIFSKNLVFYQLMGYSTEEGFATPSVLYCGSTHAYDLHHPSALKQAILMNGFLFVSTVSEVNAVYEELDDLTPLQMCYPEPRSASIMAYDLKSLRTLDGGQPIVSLIRCHGPKESNSGPLLNGYVSRFEFDRDKFVPFFVSDDRMLVSIDRKTFLVLDFSKTSREVAELDAQQLYEEEQAKIALLEEERRQREEAARVKQEKERLLKEQRAQEKKAKMEKLIEKYDEERTLTGWVDSWRGGFGFIKGDGESRELDTVFVHITAFVDRAENFIRYGGRVEFKVQYDPERTNFRATWAKTLQRKAGDHQGGRGRGGRGRGRGRGRGGYRGRGAAPHL